MKFASHILMILLLAFSGFSQVRMLENRQNGVVFVYMPEGPNEELSFCPPFSEGGDPAIEYRLVRIGIPAGETPGITITDIDFSESPQNDIEPVGVLYDADGEEIAMERSAVYDRNSMYPEDWLFFHEVNSIRGRQFLSLWIPVFRWNPVTKERQNLKKIEINITWSPSGTQQGWADPVFDNFFDGFLLNSSQASQLRRAVYHSGVKSLNPFETAENWFSFRLKGGNVYSISYEALEGSVFDQPIPTNEIGVFLSHPTMLSLTVGEEPPDIIPAGAIMEDGGDGEFGPGDEILFPAFRTTGGYRSESGVFNGYTNYFDTLTTIWIATGCDDSPSPDEIDLTESVVDTVVTSGWTFDHTQKLSSEQDGTWYWDDVSDYSFYVTDPDRISNALSPNLFVVINPTAPLLRLDGDVMGYQSFPQISGSTFAGDISPFSPNRIDAQYNAQTRLMYYQKCYLINLKPHSGQLRFASCDEGRSKYLLEGFTNPIVWDITEFNAERRLKTAVDDSRFFFVDTLRFREYLVVERDAVQDIQPDIIHEEDAGALHSGDFGADYLILTPQEFDVSKHAQFREEFNGFRTKVVYLEDIYRDFGLGNPDPASIRFFLQHAYENWQSPPPSYVLLVGDSHFDFMHRLHDEPIHFPMAYGAKYYTDEFYVSLDAVSGPEMLVGRFSAKTQHDLDVMVQKTINYETSPDMGFWRTEVMTIADDEYKGDEGIEIGLEHTTNQNQLLTNYFGDNWDPVAIYEVDYPRNSQMRKPEVNEDVMKYGLDGSIYINYVGHGSQIRWAHEDAFNLTRDVPRFLVDNKLPFVTSFSCYVARYYFTWTECIAEEMVRLDGGGGIGVVAATSGSYPGPNKSFSQRMFNYLLQDTTRKTLGMAAYSRKASFYPSHDAQYILFGDPAVEFPMPQYRIELTGSDTLTGRETYYFSGRIVDNAGTQVNDFSGKVTVKIRDASFHREYISPESGVGSATYFVPGIPFYLGTAEVENGEFDFTVFVPGDVFYNKVGGSILAYAWNDSVDAVGNKQGMYVTRSSSVVVDNQGPEIDLWFNSSAWTSRDPIGRNPLLYAELEDESGINITGLNGHQIALFFDKNSTDMIDLTTDFDFYEGSYTSGLLERKLENLEVGSHTLTLVAWDNVGNSSNLETEFEVVDNDNEIFDVIPYPSPFKNETDFTFGLTQPADISLTIFTLSGKKVRSLEGSVDSYWGKVHWDGCDDSGNAVANGTYIYTVEADFEGGSAVQKGKISRLR